MFSRDPHHTLTMLVRLAQRDEVATSWLAEALKRNLAEYSLVALDVAIETGDLIGQVLAQLVRSRASLAVAQSLERRLQEKAYHSSVPGRLDWPPASGS